MARRRRRDLGEDNHDRWLVSYADFITLLFAFFVVMYSISSVNEGKYRVLSKTLNLVFGEQISDVSRVASSTIEQELADRVTIPAQVPADSVIEDPIKEKLKQEALKALQRAVSQQRVYDELAISLEDWVDRELIDIRMNGDRIEVDMKARLLFSSGDARLSPGAMDALRQLAKSLTNIPNPIQVEGFTDDVPISTPVYQSNWELSAARAASVVQFLSAQGVAPQRLAAVGRGEYQPIADNSTEQGRAANRRVTLMILGSKQKVFNQDEMVPWAEAPATEVQ
jgi:chemotaxis protein MotB